MHDVGVLGPRILARPVREGYLPALLRGLFGVPEIPEGLRDIPAETRKLEFRVYLLELFDVFDDFVYRAVYHLPLLEVELHAEYGRRGEPSGREIFGERLGGVFERACGLPLPYLLGRILFGGIHIAAVRAVLRSFDIEKHAVGVGASGHGGPHRHDVRKPHALRKGYDFFRVSLPARAEVVAVVVLRILRRRSGRRLRASGNSGGCGILGAGNRGERRGNRRYACYFKYFHNRNVRFFGAHGGRYLSLFSAPPFLASCAINPALTTYGLRGTILPFLTETMLFLAGKVLISCQSPSAW